MLSMLHDATQMLGAWMVDGGGAMLENGIPQMRSTIPVFLALQRQLRNLTRSQLTDSVN